MNPVISWLKFSTKEYVLGTQKNPLYEAILLSIQNLFKQKDKKIIAVLCTKIVNPGISYPYLSEVWLGACWVWEESIWMIKIGKIWSSLKELGHHFKWIKKTYKKLAQCKAFVALIPGA